MAAPDNECFSRFNTPKHPRAQNLISKFFPREAEQELSWGFRRSPEHLKWHTMRGVLLHTSRPRSTRPEQTRSHLHWGAGVKDSSKRILSFPSSLLYQPHKVPQTILINRAVGSEESWYPICWLHACLPTETHELICGPWDGGAPMPGWGCLWLQNRTGPREKGERAINTLWDSHFHWCC